MRIPRLPALMGLLLVVAACDPSGPDFGPPARMTPRALPSGLAVGDRIDSVTVTVEDADGVAVRGETVTWTPSAGAVDPAASTTDDDGRAATRWTLGTTAEDQSLTARAGDIEVTFRALPAAGPLSEITLDPAARTLESVGDTLGLTASGTDRYGNGAGMPGLAWSSSDPAVASVADGVVISHAEGAVDITASSGAVSGSARVVVDQVVVAIGVTPDAPVLIPGESRTLAAGAVDARGAPVDTSLAVAWTSSDETVAAVDGSGTLSAIGPGTATVTATAGALSGQATVEVRDAERPTISGITPALLAAGDTFTIGGTGFDADPSGNRVHVAGVEATVLAAAPTALSVEMPPPGSFPCLPTLDRDVVVSVAGLEVTRVHPVGGARQLTLAVGESAALFDDGVACNELALPGGYALTVFNASASPGASVAFRLRGTGAGAAAIGADRVRPRIVVPAAEPRLEPDPEAADHRRVLEASIRLVDRLAPPPRTDPPPATIAADVGDLATFRVPDLDATEGGCQAYEVVTARAVYAGTRAVIWEDTLAPVAGQMDASWDRIGTEYDQVMHPILLDDFGNPLAYQDQLDADGRIAMLFSKVVNDFERSVAGFVWAGDFYPPAQCQGSDRREIFYGTVPTSAAAGYDDGTVAAWAWGMRSTVMHEAKHLTAYATKFALGALQLEETGIEESTARLAEEHFSRALQGYGQFDNVGYQESIWCERRVLPGFPDCDPVPLIMGKHFSGINAYLKTPAALSPLGPVGEDESSYYGSGWQLLRWTVDQSGRPEAEFLKALIAETTVSGPANLANQAGRSLRDLLADYTLAIALDDHPSGLVPARPELTMPGWNTRDVFAGLHDDYAGTDVAPYYPTPWPLATTPLDPGDFDVQVEEVRGGGAAFFTLGGLAGPQLLELLSEAGGPASPFLGMAVVRVQ
jgi:uncharacterized protein YjdB